MNIIIPIGGKGERFLRKGFNKPKPLINIFDKPMLSYVIDNLNIHDDDKIYIIYYNLDDYNFSNIIKTKYPFANLIKINKQTKGAAETILIGLETIQHNSRNKKCVLLDCDTFYTNDILSYYRNETSNMVFYTNNIDINPIYSYIKINDENIVVDIKEKIKISDNANTGAYCFSDIHMLYDYAKKVVKNDITFNSECYTSCIIDQMIKDNHIFKGHKLDQHFIFNLGTPEQLSEYLSKTYAFMFDLDGTLVTTDDIYITVWKQILKKFNIELTNDIYKNYIQGNSDVSVFHKLSINQNIDLDEISNLKDRLFIDNIDKIKIIDGVDPLMKKIKQLGHKICIVTNCNRMPAEEIIKKINIDKYIDFIIIGNECDKPKPYPNPYLCAIKKYYIDNSKCFIFEDSKSGILSGNGANPKCLIGIETIYDEAELMNCGANITVKNFESFDIDSLINYNNMNLSKIKKYIIDSTKLNIQNLHIHNEKLKGGFISDVIQIDAKSNDTVYDLVLKLENKKETFLSKMANDLGLFEREYYFYEHISNYVPIKIPKFYGIIKDDNLNNIGILMENLNTKGFILNMNLNDAPIDVPLKIISSIAKLHSKFWDKNIQNIFKDLKKNNDSQFNPKWHNFIRDRWNKFSSKWSNIIDENLIKIAEKIVNDFLTIQEELSDKNLTLCHGDVKSPNIFYEQLNDTTYEPYFIDWQYIVVGKGVQDLVFFMIESFDVEKINLYGDMFKNYYYIKILENGIKYSRSEFEKDFRNAICYFPFFVAMWFGTLDDDELIDKNFPFFFIQKLFNFIRLYLS